MGRRECETCNERSELGRREGEWGHAAAVILAVCSVPFILGAIVSVATGMHIATATLGVVMTPAFLVGFFQWMEDTKR